MTMLIERHAAGCTCSYCRGTDTNNGLHYGLNIPGAWREHNSWYVIKFGPGRYFRWTNSWLPRKRRFVR